MLFYFEKQIDSAQAGRRVVPVECDNCGCQYFFFLARIGWGSANAPFGIGTSYATRTAEERSQHDLQERLAAEAELVPCPKCHWINAELVQGYRLGRYRHAGWIAAGVAAFGSIGSFVGAWFISIGPAADRGALPYFLFGGPALSVSLALLILLLRNWLRSRIQPNRNFPLAPKLPRGAPPALIRNPATGELQAAHRQTSQFSTGDDWQAFQIGRHELPPICSHCLTDATTEHAYPIPIAAAIELKVPRCAECACAARRAYRQIWCTTATIAALFGSGVSVAFQLESVEFWLLMGTLVLVSMAFAAYLASKMTAPAEIGDVDLTRGIVMLRFRNIEYRSAINRHLQDRASTSE